METQENTQLYKSENMLLSDSNYYKFIFKKTEKIVCVVLYVLEHGDKERENPVAVSLRESAKRSLDSVLKTLSYRWYTAYEELYVFLHTLVVLESNLRVAQAVALVQEEIVDMLAFEIGSVLRALRQYLIYEKRGISDLTSFSDRDTNHRTSAFAGGIASDIKATVAQKNSRKQVPQADRNDGLRRTVRGETLFSHQGQSKTDRRRMIKDILVSNRQSTIKDISAKIPDWSEKTLQREITAMINEGTILKEGERRWSRYSLLQDL